MSLSRVVFALLLSGFIVGCGTAKVGKKKEDFFTSGSREADQRAGQTMAKHEQLTGSGEGAGEKGVKKAKVAKPEEEGSSNAGTTNKAAQVEGKLALFDRLGGEAGLAKIVSDFLPRAINDPRVNWERRGVSRSRFAVGRNRGDTSLWNANQDTMAILEKHFIQFLALATGGPAQYDGKEIAPTHTRMRITNPEFDAVIGDLKASLDKLQIPNKEQKELLSIVESTRPLIVTQR